MINCMVAVAWLSMAQSPPAPASCVSEDINNKMSVFNTQLRGVQMLLYEVAQAEVSSRDEGQFHSAIYSTMVIDTASAKLTHLFDLIAIARKCKDPSTRTYATGRAASESELLRASIAAWLKELPRRFAKATSVPLAAELKE